jgi:glycosyltransferase involved in cell wall biosynthesis
VRPAVPTAEAAAADGHRSLSDMWHMSRALSSADFDVLLFPTIYSYVPVWSRAKKAVFIHDVIAEKFPDLTLPNRQGRLFWQAKVALGRRQADTIITVSEYSRQCIVEHFGLDPDAVAVVGEANDPIFRVLPPDAPSPALDALGLAPGGTTIVYVGGFGPHKNLELLVDAFAGLVARGEAEDATLVLVGKHEGEVFHSYAGTIKQQIAAYGIQERVVFTGYLPDDDLVVLLNRATVLVLPSLMEGFGLPAIEAAACGCPVIATTASPLPDVLGDGGLYVDPTDKDGLEDALRQILSAPQLRNRMRMAGLQAAHALTWDAAAHQLLRVLQTL